MQIDEYTRQAGNTWVIVGRQEFVYNADNQLILEVKSTGLTNPTEELRTEWAYDNGQIISETMTGRFKRLEDGFEIPQNYKVIRLFNSDSLLTVARWHFFDWETESYIFYTTDFYYYSTKSTSSKTEILPSPTIYPNPTGGTLHIDGLLQPAELHIYNAQGQFVKSFNSTKSSIDLSDLPNGLYITRVMSGEQTLTEMIIKQ